MDTGHVLTFSSPSDERFRLLALETIDSPVRTNCRTLPAKATAAMASMAVEAASSRICAVVLVALKPKTDTESY